MNLFTVPSPGMTLAGTLPGRIFKIPLAMKLTAIFLLATCLQVSARSDAQRVTLAEKNAPLEKIFRSIKKQTGFVFFYDQQLLKEANPVTLNVRNTSLENALNLCFLNQPITYNIIGQTIVIKERKQDENSLRDKVVKSSPDEFLASLLPPPFLIKGRVTDEKDQPLAGVSVILKGSRKGTHTNEQGEYSLESDTNTGTLIFSSVGYETREVEIRGRKEINMKMAVEVKALDETVIVAYGTAKKNTYIGAATQLNAEKFKERPITNITSALLGDVSGVQVSTANGQPGASPAIHIRGIGTISSSVTSTPLIVLNGMPYDNPINTINPNDIESMTVLKDASSAALYGSRAANGVILIQTKGGKANKQLFNVKVNQGYTARQTGDYEKVNVADYLLVNWEATKNLLIKNGMQPANAAQSAAQNLIVNNLKYNPFNVPDNQVVDATGKLNPNAQFMWGNDVDWLGAIQRLGKRTDADVSVSGGNNKSDYYLSGGYLSEKGYIIGSEFNRYTINGNINSKITSFLKIGGTVNGVMSNVKGQQNESSGNNSNPFRFVRYIGPIYPIHIHNPDTKEIVLNANGNPIYDFGTGYKISSTLNAPSRDYVGGTNPALELQNIFDQYKRNLLSAKLYAEAQLWEGLKFTANASVSADARLNSSAIVVYPEKQNNGSASKSNSFTTTWTFNQLLTYSKNINRHHVDVLAGHESYSYEYNYLLATMSDQKFINDNYELTNYAVPGNENSRTDNYRTEGYLSRLNYDYDGRYFFSGSVRRDGTSRFYKDYRWGTFYSLGVGWRIDKERFMENVSFINLLKLRASYGVVGNDDIGTYYAWQASYEPATNGLEPGYIRERILNSRSLQWEVSHSSDLAIDFSMFRNRLNGSIEYFNRQSSNLLFRVPQAPDAGLTYAYMNAGSMYNRGVEVNISGQPIVIKDFVWTVGFNTTYLKNKITSLPIDPYTESVNRIEQGHSRYEFYLRQWAGVDPATGSSIYVPTKAVLDAYLNEPDPALRSKSIVSVKGNYYTTKVAEAMYDWSGVSTPAFSGGFNTGFSWKGISLSMLFNYQVGGKLYDVGYSDLMTGPSGSALIGSTRHRDILKRWQKPGDITAVPRLEDFSDVDLNAGTSTRWLLSSDLLELANVSIGYELPKKILSKLEAQGCRIYASSDNFFQLTKRQGVYPRKNIFSGYSSNPDVYLPSRVFTLGLSLTF